MSSQEIIFDCNILGLQRFGGVSSYLARVADGVSQLGKPVRLIRPHKVVYQGPKRRELDLMPVAATEIVPARLAQYMSAKGMSKNSIFHSPYYRMPERVVKKYVVTVHDFTYERFRTGLPRCVHRTLKTRAILAADVVICISEATKSDVLEFVPRVDETKIFVIPHGVDSKQFFSDPLENQPDLARTVLFVGQRGGYKRFDLAVEIIAKLPDLRLGIIGPNLLPEEHINLENMLPKRWFCYGHVSDDRLRQLYSSAFAFIFPSDYEGFGLPMLEAMACGCPIVASKMGALQEIGKDAALFAEDQNIDAYLSAFSRLNGPAIRESLFTRARQVVQSLQWENTVAMHNKAYFHDL
jgi:mannosyltransferase